MLLPGLAQESAWATGSEVEEDKKERRRKRDTDINMWYYYRVKYYTLRNDILKITFLSHDALLKAILHHRGVQKQMYDSV